MGVRNRRTDDVWMKGRQTYVDKGHKSVTFTMRLGFSGGKKGGTERKVLSNVRLKHLPQAGPKNSKHQNL